MGGPWDFSSSRGYNLRECLVPQAEEVKCEEPEPGCWAVGASDRRCSRQALS